MSASISLSTALVASSRTSSAGSAAIARANESNCRSPTLIDAPRSPSTCSYPWGRRAITRSALASAFAVYSGRNRLTHRVRMRSAVAVADARRLGAGFLTSAVELSFLAGRDRLAGRDVRALLTV